ncbi:uncharacterized protein LOC129777044 isoform X2 [Toxorhynchites rutilus septentrionalis]|uniref:uncharacterized protein LOC129777044 isoform X2 n=1 Tax=Toxorhynchites rutilus septentrionalis TaxID=329112 RepID=UPI002478AE7C|nr:uncharacterized protein LOC129777044 isoform X2 [Toxorhynchites rutilus septentrionalis]
MPVGRLRRRALALLGALLLVILLWPPCCATMPRPLPAVLPSLPLIDLPSEPTPAVSVARSAQQLTSSKSRKMSDLNRFMNVLTVGGRRFANGGESVSSRSTHDRSVNVNDNQNRKLNLHWPQNSITDYSIEKPIDKNKSNSNQQTTDAIARLTKLDNDKPNGDTFGESRLGDSPQRYQPQQQLITHNPTIFSILSQRQPLSMGAPASQILERQFIDRGNRYAANQSVFNRTFNGDKSISSYSPSPSPLVVLSRAVRSASPEPAGAFHHHHRHQHYLTGNGTLSATGRGHASGRHHHQQHQQQQHHYSYHRHNGTNGPSGGTGGGGDSSNLERNERSANLSHITGATRKIQLYIKNRYLQLLADGTVNGTYDDQSDFTILQRTTVAAGQIRIQGVATCLFLCMDTCGTVYGSKDFTDDCVFNEQMEQHHYNTYSSTQHSNARRTLYLALNKTGQPRKIQIPVNRSLGKLATYTKALTQTVAHDRVERLISRLFGANHVRHGLKQLCETGRALQDLTEKEMRPLPGCGSAKIGPISHIAAAATGEPKEAAPHVGAGGNKDKDSKDNLKKKKKKRRKCREDEPAGEHCFRPLGGGSVGTNSGRKRPPGHARSQKCSSDERECVSVSSISGSSPNSANSVSLSSSSNRASTTSANVPNVVASAAGTGSKKKAAKKVNNKNTPNVHNKKPKKGPGGGGGGGPNVNKKAKQQQNGNSSSSSSSISGSSSSSTVPSAFRGKVKTTTPWKTTTMRSTTTTTTSTTTTTTTTTPMPSSTLLGFDDTSQSEDDLESELDMDDLVQTSTEIIEEDELDEGNPNLTDQSLNFVDEEDLDDMDF